MKNDLARAVRLAGKSAPGPDGITYRAWKRFGETGLNVLWQATQNLQDLEAERYLEEACRDEAVCRFNEGILRFLPK